jgi:hypothetical protein
MGDLTFSYLALFIVAGLIGFVGGWFLRALSQQRYLDDLQADVGSLRTSIEQARSRRELI